MSVSFSRRRQPRDSARHARPWAEVLEDRLALSAPPIGPDFLAGVPARPGEADGFRLPAEVAVASDAAGNFVVAWTDLNPENDGGFDVYVRHFDPVGNPLSAPLKVNDFPAGSDSQFDGNNTPAIDVAMLPGGGFLVVFTARGDAGFDVLAQRYFADAQTDGALFRLDPLGVNADRPRVAFSNGSDDAFAVTYVDGQQQLFLRQFDANNAAGTELQVNTAATAVDEGQGLASDGAGNFVVAWDTTDGRIVSRLVVGGANGLLFDVSTGVAPRSAADVDIGGGQFVVVWNEPAGANELVMFRRFGLDGTPAPEGAVIAGGVGPYETLTRPRVNVSPGGDFQIVWVTQQTPLSVFVATFGADGAVDAPPDVVNVQFEHPNLAAADIDGDAASNFVIAFPGVLTPDSNAAVARIYRQEPPPPPPRRTPPPPPPLVDGDPATAIALVNAPRPIDYLLPMPVLPELPALPPLPTVPPPGRAIFQSAAEQTTGSVGVGQISGKVFEDFNGNGKQDPGEPPLEGQFVFLDLNRNARWDGGEPSTFSDSDGFYLFEYLALDKYILWQDLQRVPIEQTAPRENRPYEVTLSAAKPAVTEINFGDRLLASSRQPVVGPIEKQEPTTQPGSIEQQTPPAPRPERVPAPTPQAP